MNKRILLQKYREESGLSKSTIAEKACISVRHYEFIESGRRTPSLQVAKKISDTLKAPMDIFFS